MTRIAFIDLVFRWPPTGGSSVDIKNIIVGLKNKGFDVKLFVPLFTDYYPRGIISEELPFPIEKIPFNRFSFNFSTASRGIVKAVEEYGPDYVFFGDGYYLKPHIVSSLSKNFPVIWRFYAYEILCIMYRLYCADKNLCENNFLIDQGKCLQCQFPKSEMYREAAKIILNYNMGDSDFHHKHEFLFSLAFKKSYPELVKKALRSSKTIIVYNDFIKGLISDLNNDIRVTPSGVDTRCFIPNKHEKKISDKITIFAPGRMVDLVKGFPFFETAAKLLSVKRDDFKVLLTSNDSFAKFHGNRLRNDIFVLSGWLNQDSITKLYSQSDICVVPSVWQEPFGIMAIEAMASGLPVIATRVGGLQNIVDDGITGYVIKPWDITELMNKIETLMDDKELRLKMGKAGRKKAENEYDWDRIIEKNYLPLFI